MHRDEIAVTPHADEEAVTFSECVVGYRAWTIDALGRLWALSGRGTPWVPGTNVATCHARDQITLSLNGMPLVEDEPRHAAPARGCRCGFNAYRRLPNVELRIGNLAAGPGFQFNAYPDLEETRIFPVPGAVSVWGDLRVHQRGFRASHACVVALAVTPAMPTEVTDMLAVVAQRYRVKLVDIGDLEAEASRHGSPLPETCSPRLQSRADFVNELTAQLAKSTFAQSTLSVSAKEVEQAMRDMARLIQRDKLKRPRH